MNLQIFIVVNNDDTEPKVTFKSLVKMAKQDDEQVRKFDLGEYFESRNRDELEMHWVYLVDMDKKQILNGKNNSEIFKKA